MATSTITEYMGGRVTGTATFIEDQSGTPVDSVTLRLTIRGCVEGKVYGVHIHAGSACTDNASQGEHWDTARGEGIPSITCVTAGMIPSGTSGTTTINRVATDPLLAWSVGGDIATDVIGHTIVVHDPDVPMTRVACGVIAPKTSE